MDNTGWRGIPAKELSVAVHIPPPSLALNGRFDSGEPPPPAGRSHRYQNLIKRLVNRNRGTLIPGVDVDPVENFVPGTAWNFHRCNSAGGISEVSAITSQIEILFGRPVYGRSSQCKHTRAQKQRKRVFSRSLSLSFSVCSCVPRLCRIRPLSVENKSWPKEFYRVFASS